MKRFIYNLGVFQLPIVCLSGFVLIILTMSGELSSPEKIVASQRNSNLLVGLAYSDPAKYLKLKTTEYTNPKIISLGSSRVMQFRDYFFERPEHFYNAGGAVARIRDFNSFIDTLKTEDLQVVIIGLDQYFFNKRFDDLSGIKADYSNAFSKIDLLLKVGINVLHDFGGGKISIRKLLVSNSNIGLTAKMHHQGFRSDGSYRYGKVISNPNLVENIGFKESFDRIRDGVSRFEHGKVVNGAAIEELKEFLRNCKRKNIHVVAFLPPYAHSVWNEMNRRSDSFAYMFKIQEKLEPIFKTYSYDFFDFSDIASLGSTDDETFGGFHGSEKAYLRIIIKMSENSEVLRKYTDTNKLNELLYNAYSSREIYHEQS
jgi:hypothetical protein